MNNHHAKIFAFLYQNIVDLQAHGAAFSIHYWGLTEKHLDNNVHKHSFFEICYVLDGVGSYTDNDVEYKLEKGVMFCSRPGIWHQIRSEGMFLLFVAFELIPQGSTAEMISLFDDMAGTDNIFVRNADDTSSAVLWRGLLFPTEETPLLPKEAMMSLAHALLLSFLTLFGKRSDLPLQASRRSDSALMLRRAITYIKDNLSGPLSLEGVASYFHISGRHLSRLFSQQLGISFVGFVQQERIRHAEVLLKHSQLSVKKIAEETGFESVHYFTRTFSKAMGVPPGKYRRGG